FAKTFLRPLISLYINLAGSHESAINDPQFYRTVAHWLCNDWTDQACKVYISAFSGPNGPFFNASRAAVYLSHLPSGSSTWTVLHYAQLLESELVVHFDYGNPLKNLQKYGQMSPRAYNYSRIHTDIYLYWSRNDWIATPQDIEKGLVASLQKGVIKGSYEIPEYNHALFTIAT
ncbi:hypothetical protein PENTCL1PPCAC_15498, partial [Pristionchus entomophagus]